ncbi:MAG: GNAT family N-acetyltransferase [Deltaproteobacteria bacterium]|nr:GNAT family N-acetyltransferase [Nannocystaceae bacterium]
MDIDVVTTANPAAWAAALERAGWHDFYHECWYHQLAEQRGEGRAELVVVAHAGRTVAVPLLMRPIPGTQLQDATSVYGYAGPAGVFEGLDTEACASMTAALRERLVAARTVCLFSRLHPLRDQAAFLAGAGKVVHAGTTVSIDLGLPSEQQWSAYRADNRNRINRLRREGYVCRRHDGADVGTFIELYESTMRRVSAKAYYVFPREYYETLVDPQRGDLELWIVTDPEGVPAAAGLFSVRGDIVQYHLSGAGDAYRKQAPTTLLLDEVRRSANERGATRLHLGGGLGGGEDSLFAFKSGFGDGRHAFCVWQWILDPASYRELEGRRLQREPTPGSFFPSYRAP